MQAFLHGAANSLRRDAMLFVVLHLLAATIFRDRDQRFHASCNLIGEKHDFAIHMSRGASRRLDQRSLAAQKTFLVGIENADEGNFRKIETLAEQIDPNQNVK